MGLSTHSSTPYRTSLAMLAALALAGLAACANSSTQSSNTSYSQGQVASPTTRPPAYDPVNDRSDEGIRLNIQQANKSITYEHLKKNAEKYDGEPWTFTGKILQIQENGEQTFALISLDGWGNKTIAVKADFTTEFIEKNTVFVVGYLAGNYSYESVAGWNITVPLLQARAILKPADAARIKSGKPSVK